MTTQAMTYSAWEATYRPRTAAHGNLIHDWAEVASVRERHVWSLIQGPTGARLIVPGFSVLVQEGYLVTSEPWGEDAVEAAWFLCPCGNTAQEGVGLCEWCDGHQGHETPAGINVRQGWFTGEPVATCTACGWSCSGWECVCELVHDCPAG